MNDLDDRILKALKAEDRELLEAYKEPNLFIQFTRSFRGEWRVFMILTAVSGIIAGVLLGLCTYWYFTTTDPQVRELAAIGFICMFFGVGFTKLMHYNHVGNANVIREIKRLELQVSLLAERNN
ncbi:MAG: DUF6768 family protein [Cellvibrionaceae bacterium]